MHWLAWFWRWLGHSGPRLGHLEVRLYTRQGCHLCEDAWTILEAARRRWGYVLTAVDVDGDPLLAAEHGESIPVVTVGGTVRFRGRVNEVLLTRLLRAEERKARSS